MRALTPDLAAATIRAHRALETASGFRVAPHIAGILHRLIGDDETELERLAAGLSRDQLAGRELLPASVPPGAMRPAILDALTPAERRVLVFASFMAVDRAAVLIDATAVPTTVVLSERVRAELAVVDGRARFLRPAAKTAIASTVPEYERAAVHRALARAARSHGHLAAATWHAVNAESDAGTRPAPGLIEVAEHQARHGNLDVATRILQGATSDEPTYRVRASILAGRVALFAGHPATAIRLLESERASDALEFDEARRAALRAAGSIAASPSARHDAASASVAPLRALAEIAVRRVDRTVLDALGLVTERWASDPEEADELLARLAVWVPAPKADSAVAPDAAAASPLVEAYLRLMQTQFLLRSGDHHSAAAVFIDGFARLPFTVVDPVLSAGLARSLADSVPESHRGIVELHRPAAQAGSGTLLEAAMPSDGSPGSSRRSDAPAEPVGQRLTDAARLLFGPGSTRERDDAWTLLLSRRERNVAELVALGLRNREIGDRLGISDRTVEVHLGKIYRKAGVSARGGLIAKLLR